MTGEEVAQQAYKARQLEEDLGRARAILTAKDMELFAFRQQEYELRDQLKEATEALSKFREREAP